MKRMIRSTSRRSKAIAAGFAVAALAATGIAGAASVTTPSNGLRVGAGINQFGLIGSSMGGRSSTSTYQKGFVCDLSVRSAASSGCEVGEKFKKAPAGHRDPLFALVPIGFQVDNLECPPGLVCVDHPGTIDMTRLAGSLKPLFPKISLDELKNELKNAPAPGHNHFLTTLSDKPQYWEVNIIGVTDKDTYEKLSMSHDYGMVKALLDAKNKNVVGPLPTNIFLFFSAR
jgi:hypothetical protein